MAKQNKKDFIIIISVIFLALLIMLFGLTLLRFYPPINIEVINTWAYSLTLSYFALLIGYFIAKYIKHFK